MVAAAGTIAAAAANAADKDDRLCPTGKKMKTTSKGKRKIEIKPIEEQSKRQVTFSKRRAGLFKKSGEISLLCGAHMAVVVESPAGNYYTFGHPDADLIIHRYLTGSRPAAETLGEIVHHHQLKSVNRHYSQLCKELDAEKEKKAAINGGDDSAAAACESAADLERVFWWEEDEEGFEDEKEIEEFMISLQDLKSNLLSRADDLSFLLMANPDPPEQDQAIEQDNIVIDDDDDDGEVLRESCSLPPVSSTSSDAAAADDDDEEEWMNRVVAMMEEEGGDCNGLQDDELLCGITISGDIFWRFKEGDEQVINCLID